MNESIKALTENRNDKAEEMESILNTVKNEQRAMNEEELAKFDTLEKEIGSINSTIERMEKSMDNEIRTTPEVDETKEFAATIRALAEHRSDVNMTMGDNGAVIPESIVAKIVSKIAEISPIYAMATKYNVAGKVIIPVENTSDGSITVAFAEDFTDLESTSNKFTSITLTGYLYGALTKVSKSLLANTDFDLVNWVCNKMAEKIAAFVEDKIINGAVDSSDDTTVAGLNAATQTATLSTAGTITADELISCMDAVPDAHQANGIWIMKGATRTAIRKLKDGQNNYLLLRDFAAPYGYTLLGKPVYVSDNVAALNGTSGKICIAYGDMSGLAVKESGLELNVLTERFATQHAIGVYAYGEIDANVEDQQKVSVIRCHA